MRQFLLLTILLMLSKNIEAQSNAELIGESGDGKTFKLLWVLKSWDKNYKGFIVKRNETPLHSEIIMPGISQNRSVSIVESNATEAKRIETKLNTLIQQKKIKETNQTKFLEKLSTDEKALQGIAFTSALDYDMALIMGFGLVDRTAETGTYQYTVYATDGNKETALASCSWAAGTITTVSPKVEIKSRNTSSKKILQLIWSTDASALQQAHAAGFNVYKKDGGNWKKINRGVVMNSANNNNFTYFDSTANRENTTTYAVALTSIFGNEGNKSEYQFIPANHPLEYKAAELGALKSAGKNFENGIEVNWAFPKEYEKFIQGFKIEKAMPPKGFEATKELIPATARQFSYNNNLQPASHISLRVVAVYNDDKEMVGNDKLFYYLPVIYAPKPQNLKASLVKENKKTFVQLTWDSQSTSDTITNGYQLMASNPPSNKMFLQASIPVIKGNTYKYEIKESQSVRYRFAVAGNSRYMALGNFSDTVEIATPSASLPKPAINPYSLDSLRVTLQWKYEDVPDLKGFRVYQNGNMVMSEYELKKDVRKFITPILRLGSIYKFTIMAVTETGVESEMSYPKDIYIFKNFN